MEVGEGWGGGARNTGGYIVISSVIKQKANLKTDVCNFFPSFPHFPDSKGQTKVE